MARASDSISIVIHGKIRETFVHRRPFARSRLGRSTPASVILELLLAEVVKLLGYLAEKLDVITFSPNEGQTRPSAGKIVSIKHRGLVSNTERPAVTDLYGDQFRHRGWPDGDCTGHSETEECAG
jgi:hypothetical protein